MSIVRVGLSENQKFADGYDAIFGTRKKSADKSAEVSAKPKTTKAKVVKAAAKATKSKKKTPAKKK